MLGLSMPLLASAQFALVSQQAFVHAYAYGGSPVTQTSPEGATGNLDLRVETGIHDQGSSNASARTTVEAGRIGIASGVGGSSFVTRPVSSASSGSTASVNLYFDVTQAVQASILVERYYRTGSSYVAGGVGFPLLFEKQAENGNWSTVSSPLQPQVLESGPISSAVSGVLDLDVGHYRLQSYYGSQHGYQTSYDWGGTSILLTAAVPEPSTWTLMGLGLLGLGIAARRRPRLAA
ncbi:MAG: PEP-CTERM sorting domain-containing protein [Rubrivivax sp.]|nr:MAG: PEP-CTERM sorting domain-containing protein [Rubrivivax sp.]